jgi:hypothetical protein
MPNNRRRSARETFAACPHRYRATYLDGLTDDSLETRRGNAWHRAAELYIKALWENKQTDDLGMALDAVTRAAVEWPLPFEEWTELQSLWSRWTERFSLPLLQFYQAETDYEFAPYSCRIQYDLVLVPDPSTLLIMDFKTSYHIPNDEYLSSCLQTAMYLGAARRIFPGFSTYAMQYSYVRFGVESAIITKTHSELDAVDEWVRTNDAAMDAAEAAGVFEAHGGAHCSVCKVKCPLVADHAQGDTVRVQTAQEALQAASILSAMRQASWTLTDALRGYTEAHGPIVVGGAEWAHRPVDTTAYDAKDVLTVLEEHKADYPLTLTKTAVKPLLTQRRFAHLKADVALLGHTTTKTEFGVKQTKLLKDAEAE